MKDLRILIVGGGVAALALARALRRHDLSADVVERAAEWQAPGAGLYLPGNAVRALGELGVGGALAARSNVIRRQRFLDHGGRVLADIDVDRVWDGVGRCVAIRRDELHQILREDVRVRLGTSVVRLEGPAVTFADGRAEDYDLVVGADGVHSTIRKAAVPDRPARLVGQSSWRFIARGFPAIADWTVLLGPGRTFLTVALGGGDVYCYADVDARDPVEANGAEWRRLFAGFAEPVPQLLREADDAYFAPIEEVVPAAWTARGVALVGDAAHASSPNMAQGAALAVEDALILARTLVVSTSIQEALAVYEQRRAARVAWVQSQTRRRDRTRRLPAPLRNLTLRLAAERIYRSNYRPLRDPP